MASLARANLGTLVFVGPLERIERQLRGCPNVRFLGRRDYASLPQYLRAFDVAMVPATRSTASMAANPGKLYQYLAAGKPVVATDLPEFAPFRNVVYTARDPGEFVAQLGTALHEAPPRRIERQKAAKQCSWKNRAEQILALLVEPEPDPVERR